MKKLFLILTMLMFSSVAISSEKTKITLEQNSQSYEVSNLDSKISFPSLENLLEPATESFEVAYCAELVCCKRGFNGTQVCKVVCTSYCPIGWNPG